MKPTELTMRDVLHKEVANAIRLIKKLKALGGAQTSGISDARVLSEYFDPPGCKIHFMVAELPTAHLPDEVCAFSHIHYGYNDAQLVIISLIARHRAVWNELCSLHPEYPTPQAMESWVWDEFPEDLTFAIGRMPETPDYNNPGVIPQLGTSAAHLSFHLRRPDTHHSRTPHSILTPLWRIREQERFTHGIYIPLPDEFAQLLPQSVRDNQFPHLATKDNNQGMVAYTQSPVAGALDRQQVQKPGRYVRQFCPDLNDEQVKQAAATLIGSLSADFYHTKDAHEIRRIYMEGPQSCMCAEGRFDHLTVDGKPYHPTMIYAHPENNIELVYLEVKGRIGARALINTKKKTYPRIYSGDSVAGAGRRMETYLGTLGYSMCDYALTGEKLLRVSPDHNSEAIICPYIDNSNVGVGVHSDYLLVGDDNYEANYETGCLHEFDCNDQIDWHCDDCGEGYSDDDDRHIDQYGDPICSCCADHRVEAFSLQMDCIIQVTDDTTLYDSEHTKFSRYADALHLGGMSPALHGLAVLNDDLYCSGYDAMLAPLNRVIEHHDFNYVLEADLDAYDLIGIDGIAYPKTECIVLDGELIHDPSFDPDDEGAVQIERPAFSAPYYGLDHYMTIVEETASAEEPAIEEAV